MEMKPESGPDSGNVMSKAPRPHVRAATSASVSKSSFGFGSTESGGNAGLEWLHDNLDSMISDLTCLVECNTSFPPGNNYTAFCDLINDISDDMGGGSDRVVVPEELWKIPEAEGARVNLLRSPDLGSRQDRVMQIYFHTDTVPAGDGWTHPPFKLTREGGKLYGRGTADMKGAIAATFAALRALSATHAKLAYRPILLFCSDEEGGTYPGIRYLAEQGMLNGAILNLNGSATPRIWAGCFGSLDIRLRFFGREAHSGMPLEGVNALEEALQPLASLMELKKRVEGRHSKMPSADTAQPLHGLLSITSASAGVKGSAVPGRSEIIINRRYLPEERMEDVVDEISRTVAKSVASTALLDHDMEIIGHLPPVIDPDGPDTPRWIAAQAAGYGVEIEKFQRFGSMTSSDFGWVQKAGIRQIMLGGLSRPGRNVHGPDEHTTTTDLLGLARSIFLLLARDFKHQ
jgi:succinyl-diaminopimelate desuccinylase